MFQCIYSFLYFLFIEVNWLKDLERTAVAGREGDICGSCGIDKRDFLHYMGCEPKSLCTSCVCEVKKLEEMNAKDRARYWRNVHPSPVSLERDVKFIDDSHTRISSLPIQSRRSSPCSLTLLCWYKAKTWNIIDGWFHNLPKSTYHENIMNSQIG